MNYVRFLFGYARRDLTDPVALRTGLVTVGTILAAVAAAIGGFGFAYGVERVGRMRLDADPFAKTLWTGGGLRGGRVPPDVLADLRAAVPAGTRVSPFRTVSIRFARADGQSVGETPGRTIHLTAAAPDDLFRSRPVRDGGTEITAAAAPGIVATPKLLTRHGYDPARPPAALVAFYGERSDNPLRVPILGVTHDNLPLFHEFILSEDYPLVLGTTYQDIPTRVYTTEVPAAWATDAVRTAAENEFRTALPERTDVTVRLTDSNKVDVWMVELKSGETGLPVPRWRDAVRKVAAAVADRYPTASPVVLDESKYRQFRPAASAEYDFAAVVVPTLDDITAAAAAIEGVRTPDGDALPVNRDIVEKLARMNEQTRLMVAAVTVVQVFLVAIVVVNLLAVQTMRAERQIAEIGMLKVMGMSRWGVFATYLIEAVLLWLPAVALGVAAGYLATATAAAVWFAGDPPAVRAGTYWDWGLVGRVCGLSLAVTVGCVLAATTRAAFAPPSDTLRDGR